MVTPTFPDIKLRGTNAADHRRLRYCFPARVALAPRVLSRGFHTGAAPFEGPVLRVLHRAGSRYLDAWNGRVLTPEITSDGNAVISLPLDGGGAGCVVQSW